jgi:hypothetical protein
MDQFVIPQFIDVEDKIFGPITTRQFVILLAGLLLCFISFKLADITLFIFLLIIIGGSSLILAFVKINGQPFHYFLLNVTQTMRRSNLRIWNKYYTKEELRQIQKEDIVVILEKTKAIPHLSYNRIRDLSLVVNTGGYYRPEE